MMKNKILLLIPTFNEKHNISIIISKLKALKIKFDILFVDDNSPDGTGRILDSITKKDKNIFVIHRKKKYGIGTAHLEGINWAYKKSYNTLITLDGDLTHSPEDISKFLRKIVRYDVVVGSRFLMQNSLKDWSFHRKLLTYLGHFVTNTFLKLPFDSTCGFRVYNLKKIRSDLFSKIKSKSYSFFVESLFLLHVNNYKISEIPIILPKRTYGSSKMKIIDITKSIFLITKLFLKRVLSHTDLFLKERVNINSNLIKKERYEWDEYWKEKTSPIKYIYNFIAFFYRIIIIKPALNYFFFKYASNKKDKVLHAGCGSGQVDLNVAKSFNLTALDISPNALDKYRNCHDTNVELIHGDIFNLPFKDKLFKLIFNLGVMEHFSEKQIQKILVEFKRTLKDDGKIILFWPPKYGISVKFLSLVKKIILKIFKKNVEFHPDEITLISSKKQAERIFKRGGFQIIQSYFGVRDFFTHQIIVAKKIRT